MPTIYEEMKAANLVQGNRYSDLYVFDTHEAREIIKRHRPGMVDSFKSNVDGMRLIEIPLSYDPYWTERGMQPERLGAMPPPGFPFDSEKEDAFVSGWNSCIDASAAAQGEKP